MPSPYQELLNTLLGARVAGASQIARDTLPWVLRSLETKQVLAVAAASSPTAASILIDALTDDQMEALSNEDLVRLGRAAFPQPVAVKLEDTAAPTSSLMRWIDAVLGRFDHDIGLPFLGKGMVVALGTNFDVGYS